MDNTTASASDSAEAFLKLDRIAKQAGASITAALKAGQIEGRQLDDVLKSVGQRLAEAGLQTAGRSIGVTLASTLGSTISGGLSGSLASGGLAAPEVLTGFSDAASAGVDASGSGSGSADSGGGVTIAMTVNTPDAESFRRSEAQISAALARAVQRGQRGL
jgi:hypothetical protein